MPITNSDAQKLILNLENANVVSLIDADERNEVDSDGIIHHYEAESFARIIFPISSNSHFNLFENFKNEFVSNKFIIGFNKELFCNEVISSCKLIIGKFETVTENSIEIRLRSDSVFNHYMIGEVTTEIDKERIPYEVHKPIKINPIPFDKLNTELLKEISNYFTYQERVINIIIKYLQNELHKYKVIKPRNSSYPHKYFMFDYKTLGNDARDNILDFFNELINKGYVGTDCLQSLDDFFNDRKSNFKIRWKKTKADLWYLISQMVHRKILINTKDIKAEIIPKVFVYECGEEFFKENFKGVNKPVNVSEINNLLGILVSVARS